MAIDSRIDDCNDSGSVPDDTGSRAGTGNEGRGRKKRNASGAPDPRDYTDARNFDNPESLLSKRVIYFDFDKSTVRPEYRGIVSAHAAYAAANSTARLTLEGHADERGTREYNLGLGERRGNAVMGLMSAQGARGNQLTVVSYGEERPTCRVSEEDCWAMNRRVEIVYTAR